MPSQHDVPKRGRWSESGERVLRERYLLKKDGKVVETPDEMCWRVARAVAEAERQWTSDPTVLERVTKDFAELMLDQKFMPNSPTLMNAGKGNGLQLSACYVLPIEDSITGIFETMKHAALIHQSGGGCISGDARVWTTFCGIEPIEVLFNRATADGRQGVRQGNGVAYDVSDLGIRTMSMDPTTGRAGLRDVTHVWKFDVPPEHQVQVRMREGTVVQTSEWHPFMVVRGTGLQEVRADELRPGDVLLGSRANDEDWPWYEHRAVGSLTIDPSIGWLIGFTLGDGSFGYVPALRQYSVRWFSGTSDVLERVVSVLREYGISTSIQKDARGLLSVATLTQRFVHDLLEACGLETFGAKDARIRVPEVIAKSPLPVVRAFLAGLLDSDGYVADDGRPSLTTASEAMAEDVAALLGLLGFRPTVRGKAAHGKGRQTTYTVQLCPLPQVAELAGSVGPYMANQTRMPRLRSDCTRESALGLAFRDWRDRLVELGVANARGTSRHGPAACDVELSQWASHGRVNRVGLRTIASCVEPFDADLAAFMRRVADRGQEVEKVRRAPFPKPYYDLTVEGWNTYAAGTSGMVMIHNTGFAFSRLRRKGAMVRSTHGVASGPVSFLKVYDAATESIKQGGTRRGANMGILRCDHPDVMEFIESKLDGGVTNFNISVAITDTFMQALEKDEEYELVDPHDGEVMAKVRARDVWRRMAECAWKTGDPGVVFIDRMNNSRSNPIPKLATIEATNPCVVGSTRIATDRGLLRMDALHASQASFRAATDDRAAGARALLVANAGPIGAPALGVTYRPAAPVFKTGTGRPVWKLTTSHGIEITATPDHKFLTPDGYRRLDELEFGDVLLLQSGAGRWSEERALPEIAYGKTAITRLRNREASGTASPPTEWSAELGEVLGYVLGVGSIRVHGTAEELEIAVAAQDSCVADLLQARLKDWFGLDGKRTEHRGHTQLLYHGVPATFFESLGMTGAKAPHRRVPESVFAAPRDAVVGFLRGLFSADGSVQIGDAAKGMCSIRLASSSKALCQDVQQLLLNLGIVSAIRLRRQASLRLMPDSRREPAAYKTAARYEVVLDKVNRDRFATEVGFLQERNNEVLRRWISAKARASDCETFTTKVAAIEPAGTADVYDTTERETHSYIANGVALHNCGEQALFPYDVCNLGSINLATMLARGEDGSWRVDWDLLEKTTRQCTRFLDDVIDINPYPLPEIDKVAKENRRIGLGVMGWADMLFRLGIPYNSDKALDLGRRVMQFITDKAHEESAELAKTRGHFPTWPDSIYKDEAPLRNGTLTTVAPTGTISIIADCSSGIEPIFALAFRHIVGERHLTFINPIFEEVAKERGFYSEELMAEVAEHGTLHDVEGVPEDVKRVFVTAHEIAPDWHVKMQGAFQAGCDNCISKTINLPNEATVEDISAAYELAYKLGCRGITVYRDGSKFGVLHVGAGKDEKPKEQPATEGQPAVREAVAVAEPSPQRAQPAIPEPAEEPASPSPSPLVLTRPRRVSGYTYRTVTPVGTAFVTINSLPERGPFEVFVTVGNAGSDLAADAEALGRLISLYLRSASWMSPQERLQQIVLQLRGIGGSRSLGFGKDRVRSLPDAVAMVLEEHMRAEAGEEAPDEEAHLGYTNGRGSGGAHAALMPVIAGKVSGDLCPQCGSAGAFVYEEGCKKCHACGYSEC